MKRTSFALAAVAAAALFGLTPQAASASPLIGGLGAAPAPAEATEVQYREVRRSTRINRRGQLCRVKVVRRYTPRGVVVRRVRTCR